MKHSFFITALASVMLCLALPCDAQHHRHHPVAAVSTAAKADSADMDGIDAFSDTTAVDTASYDTSSSTYSYTSDDDFDDMFDMSPFKLWSKAIGFGVGGIILAIIVLLFVFLLLLSPFILIALVVRWLVKRDNAKRGAGFTATAGDGTGSMPDVDSMADTGSAESSSAPFSAPLPNQQNAVSNGYWIKGVKNTSVGVGLFLMGIVLTSNVFIGIGLLVCCYGLGQIFISRRQSKGGGNGDV